MMTYPINSLVKKNTSRKIMILFLFGLFSLSDEAQQLDTAILLREFEIIGEKPLNEPFPIMRLEIRSTEEISLRDAGDFLRSVPNINGIRKGGVALDPVIRGFKFSQLNVQINNGQKIEGGCPNRMDNPASHVEMDDLTEIDVIKGPYALRYGPGFGGIINMKTLKPVQEKGFKVHAGALLGFETNWNGLKQRIYARGGNQQFYFYISGNHKDYGNYSDGNGNEVPSKFTRYNYNLQAGFTPVKDQQFLLAFENSYGRNVVFPALPMDEREDNTRLVSLDYKGRISKTFHHLHFKVYLSNVHHIMDNKERPFSDTVVAVSDVKARNLGYSAEVGIQNGSSQLFVGTDLENIDKDGNRFKYFIMQPTLPKKVEMLWENAHILNMGYFSEWVKNMSHIRIVAAIRLDINHATSGPLISENMSGSPVYLDDNTSSDFVNFSFSAGAAWNITTTISLSLSMGSGTRSPDMNERYITLLPIGYDPYDYLGNPQLQPETNNQADLIVNIKSVQTGNFNVNVFYSYVNRYISAVLVPETVAKPQSKGVYGVKQFRNAGNVWLTGFEFTWETPVKWKWGALADAAFTYGVDPEATKYIVQNGEVTGSEIVKNDALSEIPPFEGNISLFYKFLDGRLIPKANIRLVAAQKHISQSFEETETPGFFTAGVNFFWQANTNLSVSGGVSNIFNKAYYEHLNRRMINTPGNLYEPGRTFYLVLQFKI